MSRTAAGPVRGRRITGLADVRKLPIGTLQPSTTAVARMLVDPATSLAVLLLAVVAFGQRFDAEYVILALLTFALLFPGRVATTSTPLKALVGEILMHWLVVAGVLLLLGWSTETLALFDRRVLIVWLVATPFALLVAHASLSRLLQSALAAAGMRRTAVIVGANRLGRTLAQRIQANPYMGTEFAGYFDDRTADRLDGVDDGDVLGSLSDVPGIVKARGIDVVYCALPMCEQPRVKQLLEDLRDTTASIYFVPDVLICDLMPPRFDSVSGMPVVAFCESPYYGVNAVAKRLSDLLLASLILIAIAPLLAAIAIGVKATSPGPVLFKQRRYGMDGKEIVVYKFRTMTCLEDGDSVVQARRDDPRITPFGAFLRAYSLDELPQFVNVLQGRMAVVGPRPHAVAHNELYRKLINGYMVRHKVKPGITGLAQVRGLRGETDTVDKMRERVELDLEYLRSWSLLLDLKIVLRTVLVVVKGSDNAY